MAQELIKEVYLQDKSFSTAVKDNRADYEIKRSRHEKRQAQHQYCASKGYPIFADDNCWKCGTSTFDKYSLNECSSMLITGCRNCNKSFVD